MQVFDSTINETLIQRLSALEKQFSADVVFYYGEIHPYIVKPFRDFIEKLQLVESPKSRLAVFLNTPGGSAEAVEKLVEIMRFHYKEVFFIVPDFAMSAGTILCMSGDKIFMDYSSSLGPIDPQVFNGKEWVPALGYIDKVEQMLEKDRNGQLTNAEFLILQSLDLALLSRYEQARDLTVTLLKKWLVEYKFKDWKTHRTNTDKRGKCVTDGEKRERAEEIARKLGNNRQWHSHGRMISPTILRMELKLEIDDYSKDSNLRELIRSYNDLLVEYIRRGQFTYFLHSKNFF